MVNVTREEKQDNKTHMVEITKPKTIINYIRARCMGMCFSSILRRRFSTSGSWCMK